MPKHGHRRRNAGLRQPFRSSPAVERPEGARLAFIASFPDPATRDALITWQAIDARLFVYFIQAEDGGPVKIGKATDPVKRLAELQCGNPGRLVIRALLFATADTERSLHAAWSAAHVRGEWFGHGYQDVILALAQDAQALQLSRHDAGDSLLDIAEICTLAVRHPKVAA